MTRESLEALVMRWREEAIERINSMQKTDAEQLDACADELEAALNGSSSGVDAAFAQLEHEKAGE